jgi:PAS domain S-box-containing protein
MVPEYARKALLKKFPENRQPAALIAGADGRIVWANEALQRLMGYQLEDLAGRRPGHVMHGPDTDPEVAAAIARALKAQKPVKTPILSYKKDRTPIWIELEILPLFDEGAKFAGFISFGEVRPGNPGAGAPCCCYNILVAEDHPINLKLVVALLQAAGCETHCAENGKEALAAFEKEDFDLIIMDSQMPVLTGVEAIAIIRNRPDWKQRTPIMSLTAHAMRGAEEYHTLAGADVYMSKPIRSDCFIGAVKNLAKRGRDLRVQEGGIPLGTLPPS